MGWWDYHLHEFKVDGVHYGVPDEDDAWLSYDILPEKKVTLGEIVLRGVKRFKYAYDFGDGWRHTVVIEKTGPGEAGVFYPRCTAGRRAAVPEDCGGHWGFAEFKEAMADPHHPEHAELRRWYGGDFDPDAFDIDAINEALRSVVKEGVRR